MINYLCFHPIVFLFKMLPEIINTGPHRLGLVYGVYRHFEQYVSYIVAVSFISWVNRSTQRKLPTCRKSLTNFITLCCIEYTSSWTRFVLTTLIVIGTHCTGNCKFQYHSITTTMVPGPHIRTSCNVTISEDDVETTFWNFILASIKNVNYMPA